MTHRGSSDSALFQDNCTGPFPAYLQHDAEGIFEKDESPSRGNLSLSEKGALPKRCPSPALLAEIYESAFMTLDDGLAIVDSEGCILALNAPFSRSLGVEAEQAVGAVIDHFFEGPPVVAARNRDGTEILSVARKGGEHGLTALTRRPVRHEGSVVAWILAARDRQRPEAGPGQPAPVPRQAAGSAAFTAIRTQNAALAATKRMAERFAGSGLPILLQGETGVGKDVFANAIHRSSPRASLPLVCVNCAAIPEELLESELFGYVDGAFTGGRRLGKKGKFELADRGTLFLDEIGEMPPQMQSKLLRVLQTQEVEKLGAEMPIKVDVRIIAATNCDLVQAVESGAFRADLFYRLNVLPIVIPPLRERKEDINDLARRFLSELVAGSGREVGLSAKARAVLEMHDWPGNVRELRNVIGRAFMIADGPVIGPEHLLIMPLEADAAPAPTIDEVRACTERDLIISCLKKYDGNFPRAAQALGIHRATLYSRLHRMGIPLESFR